MSPQDQAVIEEFRMLGLAASFHYADDTTKEWAMADAQKKKALKIFDDNPHLHEHMRVISAQFLWSLTMERKR